MPSPTSKVRKGQLLTSERRGIDNVFKGSSPTSSQSDLPSPLTACVLREKVTEKGLTDPWSPSHVWQAEGEESKPFQFRDLSLVQCAPQPRQLRVYSTRLHIALTFSRGEPGVDGEARDYSSRCLLSNRSYFVWRGRERRKAMKRHREKSPWTFVSSGCELNPAGIRVRGVPWGRWAGAVLLGLRISIFILTAGGWGVAAFLLFLIFLSSPWGRRMFSSRVWLC